MNPACFCLLILTDGTPAKIPMLIDNISHSIPFTLTNGIVSNIQVVTI